MSVLRFLCVAVLVGLFGGRASAQIDIAPGLANRPPVAAPTSQISVAPIEVVRSASEIVNDFGGGLIQGLLASNDLRNATLIAAQDNRIITNRSFGCCMNFSDLLYSDLLAPIAALQLLERQRLKLDANVSDIVAGYGGAGVAVGQVLAQQTDPAALRRIVEAASGEDFRSYVSENILSPLGAAAQPDSLSEVVGRLLVALLNGGAFEGGRILEPATVDLLARTQFSIHPALPGWSYGFAEMRRKGWRALQRDGVWLSAPRIAARLVVVPEAHLAYFIAVEGQTDARFWRVLDDALFDRVLPMGSSMDGGVPQVPAPTISQARAVAGVYEASSDALASAAPLKVQGERVVVRASDDGGLILSGSESDVLAPRQGGYWAAQSGNLNAVASDGRLVLSSGLYEPLRWWKRPALYASLTLVSGVVAVGAFVGERRRPTAKPRGKLVQSLLAGAFAAFLAATLFVWHLGTVL